MGLEGGLGVSKDADGEVLHVGRPLGSQLEELDIAAFHAIDEDCWRGPPHHLPAWRGNHLGGWAATRGRVILKLEEAMLTRPFLPPALPRLIAIVGPLPKGLVAKTV